MIWRMTISVALILALAVLGEIFSELKLKKTGIGFQIGGIMGAVGIIFFRFFFK